MTDERLAELRRLAEAATPGPWEHDLDCDDGRPEGSVSDARGGCVCFIQPHANMRTVRETGQAFDHNDARYIAAANPQTMLELLAEIDRLRRPFS